MRDHVVSTPSFPSMEPRQRFLLWAIRVWVGCYRARALPAAALSVAFGQVGLGEGAAALHLALKALAAGTRRPIDVHCPHCGGLSADEALLLEAIGAAQQGDEEGLRRRLSGLVAPAHVDRAATTIGELARMLAVGGLILPDPDEDLFAVAAHDPIRAVTVH
jgi:hypothetical protein